MGVRLPSIFTSEREENAARSQFITDPDGLFAQLAGTNVHWYCSERKSWLSQIQSDEAWTGYREGDGAPDTTGASWQPWDAVLDNQRAPFRRWFVNGKTNLCFNLVDRHVLSGRGDQIALIFEGDRWDPSKDAGRGGPVSEQHFTYRQLLEETVVRARVLSRLGLTRGDRIALNMPNIPEQIFYILAAQRIGVVYTPVFGGFSAKTLSDRIHDAGARVVITADGGYRNAEAVPYKSHYSDPALDNYIPRERALAVLSETLETFDGLQQQQIVAQVRQALEAEITLERADVMRELGAALSRQKHLPSEVAASLRTRVATALAATGHDVTAVVVVRYTGQEVVSYDRDLDSTTLVDAARASLHAEGALQPGAPDDVFWAALNSGAPVEAVEANWPAFIIYTSGSTGKPKGVVHTHGAWIAGVTHTMRTVFESRPDDVMMVVGDPGWITGQSYMIAAPLSMGMTTVVNEGSPLFPHAGRFASVIERHGVTLFKAGSTFLKAVMTDPASKREVAAYDLSSLRAATFCAEPVSPAVQKFAMENICPRYINSYWATEHGGIVFTCPWGDYKHLAPDAKTWSLPWIQAEVRIAEATASDGSVTQWRVAEEGEKGELVITQPYPYLASTLWGDAEHLGDPDWCGDIDRFTAVYFSRWHGELSYTQGDYARRHEDGAFTLHGRSDDVINVSGHRIGTEEIEGAILRDKTLRDDSPVGNVVVVGAPHDEKGETPVAFLVAAPGRRLSDDDFQRLQGLVRTEKGATAVPGDFLVVSAFPETRSGKYMRRTLRAILLDEPLGDLSTLKDPAVVDEIRGAIAQWRDRGQLAAARAILQTWRNLRVETHLLPGGQQVALVVVSNPPVNALNERALDELHAVVQQLGHADHIAAVIITGNRNTFVAGADIKELLKIGEVGDLASAITPPNAAQTAFEALENIGKPVIAAINGPALGGGNELLLACAYAIAESHATFGQPEINLNLLPGYGGTQRLVRKLFERNGEQGAANAVATMLRGRPIDAADALAMGLIDEVLEPGGKTAVAQAVAQLQAYFAGRGPLAEVMYKRRGYLANIDKSLALSTDPFTHPSVATVQQQLIASGRVKPLQRIRDAVLYGLEKGQQAGLKREATLFAEAVCDPASGPTGIAAFLEKRSAALPLQAADVPAYPDATQKQLLIDTGDLLPLGASFFPGVTPLPRYQFGLGVARSSVDGSPAHGDPIDAERLLVFPTPEPKPTEALVYVLASEMNFNDIWAITGIPVSPFDAREADVQVTGSGGVGLIAQLGESLVAEGRLAVGDIVTIYSGQSELMSPDQGLDPMAAGFHIQGYERNDGSHAQFLTVQGPQLHPKLPKLSFEEAGSYGLTMGTIHRALYTTLAISPGKRLFVEGAATGTGYDCLRSAVSSGLSVVGMVSDEARGQRVIDAGGAPLNRKDPAWADVFSAVPDDPALWQRWEQRGEALVAEARAQAGGDIDYVVSHAGETAFPRSFQMLSEGGVLTFYGASSGYRFTFMGKPGAVSAEEALQRAGLRAGQSLLIIYGPGAEDGIVDRVGIEAIEAACQMGVQTAVLVDSVAQREFVASLGFGPMLRGIVSIEELAKRLGDDFVPPGPFPDVPDPFKASAEFKEAVRLFTEQTLKPIGSAVAPALRNTLDKRGLPDVVFERSGRDGLALATALVKPNVGKVVYSEDLSGQRLSFYAPQVWTRQRRILMPTAEIRGTHLNTAREFAEMQERIASGHIDVLAPVVVDMDGVAEAHQAMWENRHQGANYVAIHALPRAGLKSKDELYRAWALRDADARGDVIEQIETGSAGALR